MRIRVFRLLSILAVLLLVAASCGDDDDSAGEADPTPTESSDTTPEPSPTAEATAEPSPTEVTETGPVWPLTGLPLDDEARAERPALVVKIDNNPDALPQWGINQADIVVEILVEGITRLAAVFHSDDADPVGPVRSGRTSDPDILANFGRPLLAWSGGNPTVMAVMAEAQAQGLLIDIGAFTRNDSLYYRYPEREAPHNLLSSTPALYGQAPPDATPPPQLFTYRTPGDPPGDPVDGVTVTFTSLHRADFVWDAERGVWLRWQNRAIHVDDQLVPAAPVNVVVIETPYGISAADPTSPEAQSIGGGAAWVFSEGRLQRGRWVRGSVAETWQLIGDDGEPLTLVPGQTWIELAPPGTTFTMDADTATALLDGLEAELEALQPADDGE
ncbi:MAG: DUF3048 domain-containing protein [Acidimicrobiales bacterium]|nr:DUF3048 domain-containing protein [Acidimicrobiales bacterium]